MIEASTAPNALVVAERNSPEAISKVMNVVCTSAEFRGRKYTQSTWIYGFT
jgi:hypothetical protein